MEFKPRPRLVHAADRGSGPDSARDPSPDGARGPALDAARESASDSAPDPAEAAQAFAALGSEPRLEVVRALVRAGPGGMPVGALQARLGIAASTLSHHLRFLAAAGLLSQERQGRSLICRADFARIDRLADFLRRECCADLGGPRAAPDPAPEAPR